jgi:superfamily II DNA or RNA helicase
MDTRTLQEALDHASWEGAFEDKCFARAATYYHNGRVERLQHQPGDGIDVLTGTVRGSERLPYRCKVDLFFDDDELRFDSQCSCPMQLDCKHVAAVMMMATATPYEFWPGAAEAPSAPTTPTTLSSMMSPRTAAAAAPRDELAEWTRWLMQLDHGRAAHEAPVERQFGLLLRGSQHHTPPALLVNLVWLRPGRSTSGKVASTLVDPQPLRLDPRHGPVPTPAGGWPRDVVAALALLLQEQHTLAVGQSWIAVHAAYQEDALSTLLARYPVYHERGAVPLTRGEPLPLRLQWHDLDNGSQRLQATVSADTPVQLLRGARLWYVLPQERRFGLVEGDASLVGALDNAPLLAPEQVPALRQRLQQSPGTSVLPAPNERTVVERIEAPPVPVLQLRVVASRPTRGKPAVALGIARLAFDYDVIRLPADIAQLHVRRLQGSRVLEIHRQLAEEARAEQRLQRAGLVSVGWHSESRGIPERLVKPDDLLLRPQPNKPVLPASAWQPVIEQLAADGFHIEYSDDFPQQRQVDIEQWHADVQPAGQHWFDVNLGIDVEGQRIDLLPLLRRMLNDPAFPLVAPAREKKSASWRVALDETRSVEIPLSRLRALIEPLLEWLQGDGELRLHRTRAEALVAMASDAQLHWHGGELLRAQLDLLPTATRSAKAPKGFKATLRPYQREGLAWLDFLGASGLGGILADDMGLGKTVQVLAHILGEKQRGRLDQPALVVAPTSLVGNWRDEAARFAPALKVLVIHGADRADRYDAIAAHDLVITTYPLLPRDREQLLTQRFALLVLDEAQAIKNASSQAAQVVREIPAARRLAMTGTPLENHLGELWAQFDAVEPGLLGSQRQFVKLYRTPIEKHGDADRQRRLNRRIGPLLLRRRKDDVLTDLPAKTEIVHMLELAGDQRALYETLRLAQHERVQQAVRERGLAQSGIIVLDALLKLRQACCDPPLVKLASAKKIKASAKLDALLELLDGLLGEGRRVLLFSQFTEMLALIETALDKRRVAYQILTGQTPAKNRSALVKRFQGGDVPVFLISLKAGGVGLNLTAADTVIHYDPWWNPAVEAQATDRAHRIGQDKPVFVYRLICSGTVEEKIQAMQGRKAELAHAVLEGGGATQQLRFNERDLAELFAPL